MAVVLAFESSCDECSVAVVENCGPGTPLLVRSVATYSQIDLHRPYGGVVPEIAARNHLDQIIPMLDQALVEAGVSVSQIDAVAVTVKPGLVGPLLVGLTSAKAWAYVHQKPLIPVHHLEGHLMSPFLSDARHSADLNTQSDFPAVVCLVSGGHTQIHAITKPLFEWAETDLETTCLGRSRDDAAGEAFDKTAKLLGFPYPGGKYLDQAAKGGNPKAVPFPRALMSSPDHPEFQFDMSFSGLKTAVATLLKTSTSVTPTDLCASIQEAILDVLIHKSLRAVKDIRARRFFVVGGVAANSRLRQRLQAEFPIPVTIPPLAYCTDNAAMIGAVGCVRWAQGRILSAQDYLTLKAGL